ncbi:MAG: hypothetical protein JWO31_2492 [Phycisphaerales bacterium]|nr:hypothetical protein [Phycisphaerales bacterium]
MNFNLTAFTLFHVAISLTGIASGLVVAYGMLGARRLDGWTVLFLATTVATSVTGFLFPFQKLMPSHVVGAVSLLVLPLALYARYGRDLAGRWRATYVLAALFALYLNVFVLVAQAFQKVPALKALAPTQSEPPFALAQLVVLAGFAALTVAALIRFRPERLSIENLSVQVA